ncbi:MAG: hypothetical protein HY290_07645 [Planctomycetia bacterium]|nr:hypothetical protein [Planctomycetia bacterium]
MRALLIILAFLLAAGCSKTDAPVALPPDRQPAPQTAELAAPSTAGVAAQEADSQPSAGEDPSEGDELGRLLSARLNGGMQHSFGQFANMFLVMSRLNLPNAIGLMTKSEEIAKAELQSPFPPFYHPTVREFLDAIALQTFSEWQHDASGKFIKSEVEIPEESRPVIFEFTATEREKPFEVTLAEEWKSIDKGNWVMLVPPSFPVGMDIYEMGTYSMDSGSSDLKFFEKVRSEVALEWAQRVAPDAKAEDLKPARVGSNDALHFEKLLTGQNGKQIRWRHWVFMVENKCYFIVSTIVPALEDEIFPDVEKMVASFKVKSPRSGGIAP